MKLLTVALTSGVSLLAMTAHAHADFIVTPIAYALFAGPLGAVASFSAIYTGVQAALVLGAQFAVGALTARSQKIDPGEMKNTFQEAETSEFNAVGRVKLGGLKAFGNTKGNVISRLIWHVKGPEVAIEQYFLGGREVTVEANGAVSSPPWAKPSGSWAYLNSKKGDGSETAWPDLMTDFPDLWTSAHRCRGIFQSLIRFSVPDFSTEAGNKKFQKLYQGGAPDGEVVARVSPIFDPRDPSQNVDSSATWKWTDNGILCAAHIMRTYPDLTRNDFDWTFIAAEAAKADTLVATKTGTEPRARCWGVWPSESKRGDTMQQVLDSIGAEVVMSDAGLIRIRLIDDAPTSELDLPARHIQELNWKSGPEAVERPNICRIKYYSPERGYDMGEINMAGIGWARVDDEVARYGEKVFDVELPFCPSASQAQRIARRLFFLARADAGTVKTNMVGLAAWGKTYLNIEDDLDEVNMLSRIAPPRIDDEAGMVEIPYVVWPRALIDQPWDTTTMEASAPIEAPDLQYESELDTPEAPSNATVVQYPGGAYETRLKFEAVPGGTVAEAVYRIYMSGEPDAFQSMTEYDGAGSTRYAYDAANTVGKKLDAKCRFFNAEEDGSYYSPLLAVDPMTIDNSAPAAPTLDVILTNPGSGSTYHVEASAKSAAMNVASVVVTITTGTIASGDARPDVAISGSFDTTAGTTDRTITITAYAYSSNGTASPAATYNVVIPGTH